MQQVINNTFRADFDIQIESFSEDIDLKTISRFPMISIYKNPKDYPDKFVARVFDIQPGKVYATRYIRISEDIDELRRSMPSEFSFLDRTPMDDPELVEIWF